jgi:hypothetical protein
MFIIQKEVSSGIRAREWNATAIQTLLNAAEHPSERVRARLFACSYFADRGETVLSGELLDEALQIVSEKESEFGLLAQAVWLEKACNLAGKENNPAAASEMLSKVSASGEEFDSGKYYARAAIKVAEQDGEGALALIDSAADALQKSYRRTGYDIASNMEELESLRNSALSLLNPEKEK